MSAKVKVEMYSAEYTNSIKQILPLTFLLIVDLGPDVPSYRRAAFRKLVEYLSQSSLLQLLV